MKYLKSLIIKTLIFFLLINVINCINKKQQEEVKIKFKNLKSTLIKSYSESNMEEIQKHLKHILVERVADTPNHKKVREYIVSQFDKLYWDIEFDSFKDNTPFGEKTFTNIILTSKLVNDDDDDIVGVDNKEELSESPKTLILSAHYDSKYFKEFSFLGATDSAVPCSMLIDLAISLQSEIKKSKKRLMIIFFDGEEAFKEWSDTDSLYGSRHLANLLLDKKVITKDNDNDLPISSSFYNTVEAFILLDLLGAPNPRFYMFNKKTESLFKKLSDIEDKLSLKRFISPKPYKYFQNQYIGSNIQDDHMPFLNYVPTLHIIPYPFPNVWHTEKDNESCLDKNTIEDLSKIFKIFVGSYLN
ncbi:hypothetical protein RB653_003337 [Dictyostelium firmibasis]|uniref:Peptidase M28 domain-containing protein n=1 Tax=Dictyostelium firmibasis TaxID=79012 RepID=A0AAN7TXM5_9MYCE